MRPSNQILRRCVVGLLLYAVPMSDGIAAAIDLSAAELVVPPAQAGPENKAAEMLVDEVAKRSEVRWPQTNEAPAAERPVVYLGERGALLTSFPSLDRFLAGPADLRPEGYRILSEESGVVIVAGNDSRGVLYGAGRLLRLLDYTGEKPPDHLGTVSLQPGLDIATAPRYSLRGHQIGYRPKTNAYDGWNQAMWEQYIRDLIIFGANAVEGIPPRSDDIPDSPQFTLPPMQMLIEQSRLAQEYGIEYWIWYPLISEDYGKPSTVDDELKRAEAIFRSLPELDAVFVPGGDPGHTAPEVLFPVLRQMAEQLQRFHPKAKLWMSPQGFSREWMNEFYRLVQTKPSWLEGVVFGPQQIESIGELRAHLPERYKLRFYPDITHSITCQFPVPNWSFAYAATENRETINPRPMDEAAIFRHYQPYAACGVLTYSEGCNDDVNKCIWSSLAWNPDEKVIDILRDYSHYFIGHGEGEGFAQGLLALERNWRGPLETNTGVYTTLAQFQDMERSAPPAVLENWRFQEGLYRAYYDALDRARLLAEEAQEQRALDQLRRAGSIGDRAAITAAEAELTPPLVPVASAWRARVFQLAEALFQSIHMQLSVPRYWAEAVGRGANLDLIDSPLSDGPWLTAQLAEITNLGNESERLKRITALLDWSDPGPGGFYDDLGNADAEPHLVRTATYAEDPAFLSTPYTGFSLKRGTRVSSATFAQTLNDQPLEMVYHDLDRAARYRVKIVYGSEARSQIQLVANGAYQIHPLQEKNMAEEPLEYDIPPEATAGGELRLTWSRPPGLRGDGRGVQIAEVWLICERR